MLQPFLFRFTRRQPINLVSLGETNSNPKCFNGFFHLFRTSDRRPLPTPPTPRPEVLRRQRVAGSVHVGRQSHADVVAKDVHLEVG